jgi:uncharacterized protein (DUF1778 family)
MNHADSLSGLVLQPMIYTSPGMRSWKSGGSGSVTMRSTPALEPLGIFQKRIDSVGRLAHNRRTITQGGAMTDKTQTVLAKSARFHVRATSRQAQLIRAGASRRGVKLTDYILDSLCTQAEMDLADQNHFVLPKEKWDAFLKALDGPPKVPPGLKRLFSRPSRAASR